MDDQVRLEARDDRRHRVAIEDFRLRQSPAFGTTGRSRAAQQQPFGAGQRRNQRGREIAADEAVAAGEQDATENRRALRARPLKRDPCSP